MKQPVDSPFEQAIFIVRSTARPVEEADLLRQARESIGGSSGATDTLWQKCAAFLCGAGAASLVFLLVIWI